MAGRVSSVLAWTSRRGLGHRQISLIHARAFATHNETASSLLSQQLERNRGRDAPSSAGPSSVGPFPLGVQPLGLRSSRQPAAKPWDQLTPGGKVLRTTARASNLTVILIGATLSVVLTYALATELFAKNSPTVLYGDACDRIKDSEEVKSYLPGTLSFHTTPPSPVPSRHRNRHPQSHLAVDSNGVEHLLLHFWVTSSHIVDAQKPGTSWSEWIQNEWDLEWDWERVNDARIRLQAQALGAWESAKQTAAFLSGIPIQPSPSQVPPLATTTRRQALEEEGKSEGAASSFFGLFRNLKLGGAGRSDKTTASGLKTQWDSAEVHADMVKDASGVFQYRYLLVDLPNSRVRRPVRVVVARGHGFSDRDGIFMWQ